MHVLSLHRWLLALLLLSARLGAATYGVAPDGDDTAAGSPEAPWRTLGHAALIAAAGDTVEVRGGVYAEQVKFGRSGTADAPIVFRARAGETPVIDGATLTAGPGWSPLLRLHDVSHVTIEGFGLRGLKTDRKNHVPVGILVTGSGEGVRLLDNHIHDLGTTWTGARGGDAHGIAVYGNATAPVRNILIRGNRLHDLRLGSSEALVLNGNVTGFLVEANRVHACNNIGIDLIGHEGTCPDPEQDAAREGIIRMNTVFAIDSFGNPAYGKHRSAGGIYVDGGRDLLIELNTVFDCNIGIELASEHAGRATRRVTVRNNVVSRNHIGGLFMGGYDRQRGRTEACRIERNTFFENDTLGHGNGEIHLQFDVRDTAILHNVIVTGPQALVIGNPYAENTGNTVDHNVVRAPGTPRWRWKNREHAGWRAWREASGQDAHSVFSETPSGKR
ncbi:polysaccharide lyase [Opitutaceae bacterium TAV5]|nr:polysaccharide lyase [Opitutaceae bacterium TAV5]